jgi:hypothetical protein
MFQVKMGICKAKRKRGLRLSLGKKPALNRGTRKLHVSMFNTSCSKSPAHKKRKIHSPVHLFKSTPRNSDKYTYRNTLQTTDISPIHGETSGKKQLVFPEPEHNLEEHFSLLDISGVDSIQVDSTEEGIITSDDNCQEIADIMKSLPLVIKELGNEGYSSLLQKFCKLVAEKKFPLQNISLRLWADVVEWYGLDDTRNMRYSPETLQFFWLGRKLFGGKFVRFMSGLKNENDFLLGHTVLDPQNSKMNFACPSENVLREINPMGQQFPDVLKPGILKSVIELKKEYDDGNTSYILMFDGKKVKRGGDVNLLGYEDKPLQERIKDNDNALKTIEVAINEAKRNQGEVKMVRPIA